MIAARRADQCAPQADPITTYISSPVDAFEGEVEVRDGCADVDRRRLTSSLQDTSLHDISEVFQWGLHKAMSLTSKLSCSLNKFDPACENTPS